MITLAQFIDNQGLRRGLSKIIYEHFFNLGGGVVGGRYLKRQSSPQRLKIRRTGYGVYMSHAMTGDHVTQRL